ncbi:MAG: GEVED domain-containing protein [Acidobacteriota bacterium]
MWGEFCASFRGIGRLCVALLCAVAAAQSAGGAQIQIQVTNDRDWLDAAHGGSDADTGMSLREAIIEANRDPANTYEIVLTAGWTYNLTRQGRGEDNCLIGDLDIHGSVIIDGQATLRNTWIKGNGFDRVFHVHPGARLELKNLTVSGGLTSCGEPGGGAIYNNAGALALTKVTVQNSRTPDCTYQLVGSGGGIYSEGGSLTLTQCDIGSNRTGSGGNGEPGSDPCDGWDPDDRPGKGGHGGSGGKGGGIAVLNSSLRIEDCVINNNHTGNGGDGAKGGNATCEGYYGGDGGDGGSGGYGGGIYIEMEDPDTPAEIVRTRISSNSGGFGGKGAPGGSTLTEERGQDGDMGGRGDGAGIAGHCARLIVRDCTIENNTVHGFPSPVDEWPAHGAGIYNFGGVLTIERSTVARNKAESEGKGGGIWSGDGSLEIMNSTIISNTIGGNWGGGVHFSGGCGAGDDHQLRLSFSTITGNGGGGVLVDAPCSVPYLRNNIIAGNNDFQYWGAAPDRAFDIEQDNEPAGLGPLQDNGGPTQTRALLDGSPAINAGDPSISADYPVPSTDQRGHTRAAGGRADIGAYEKGVPAAFGAVSTDPSTTTEGALQRLRAEITGARLKALTLTVDWGDGTTDTFHETPWTDPYHFTPDHVYGNNPPGNPSWTYTARLTLKEDSTGVTDSTQVQVIVDNRAPTWVDLGVQPASIAEGGLATLDGRIHDSVSAEGFTVTVAWGDGLQNTYTLLSGTNSFSVSHRYVDNRTGGGACTITVNVVDDDGASAPTTTTELMVTNVAPTLSNLQVSPTPVNEGATATLTGQISDPGSSETFTLQVVWGDGSTNTYNYGAGTTSFSVTHVYVDDDPTATAQDTYTVSVSLADDDGGSAAGSATADVANVAPRLSNLTATACDEGSSTTLTGTISDSLRDSFTLQVTWPGGAVTSHTYPAGTTSFSVTRAIADDNPSGTAADDMIISATITDDDGGSTAARATARVSNVPPTVSGVSFSASEINEGGAVALQGTITDPGPLETFTIEVDWGDGTSSVHEHPAGTTAFTLTHTYRDDVPGADVPYTATVTVRDDDTGASTSATAEITVHNLNPWSYHSHNHAADEDVVLAVTAPGVLADDADHGVDDLRVDAAASDTLSRLGARITIYEDGSFTYDPTARDCSLQDLGDGETRIDVFNYTLVDDDGGSAQVHEQVTITGHDETGIIYVRAGAPAGGDGNSWAGAFNELVDGLAAAWGGNTIHVAAGTYLADYDRASGVHTGSVGARFELHRGVALIGGFPPAGGSEAERSTSAYPTVLSGMLGGGLSSRQIIGIEGQATDGTTTIVDGFTISGAANADKQGGGMVIEDASPVVANCTFTGNAARDGGGIAVLAGSSPHIVNCTFSGNSALEYGGGLFADHSSPVISGSVFRGNAAGLGGGGLNASSATVGVANCTFTGNSSHAGGAVADIPSAAFDISNSLFWGNTADDGAEVYIQGWRQTTIRYSDVAGSSAPDFWTNLVDGGGNLDLDPAFVPGDVHLQATSPAIDAGDNVHAAADAADLDADGDRTEIIPADRDGLPRFVDAPPADSGAGTPPIVDMGAYEVQTKPVLAVFKSGTGSGRVTSTDPADAIDCGGDCMRSLEPGEEVTLAAQADSGSTFAGWMSAQPGTCPGSGGCTVTMPAAGSVWVGALFLVTPTVDLAASITNGRDNLAPGEEVTYTITVTNAGPEDASGALVTAGFPVELGTPQWTCAASAGSSCTVTGTGNILDTVSILADGSLTYLVTATLSPATLQAVTATASVNAPPATPDGTLTNNSSTDTDTVGPEADLSITKTDGVTLVAPGSSVTYTILVTNHGPSAAVDSTVTDTFPAGLTDVSWTCVASGGDCTASGTGDIADTADISAGGTLTYTVTGAVAATTGTLVNTATVTTGAGYHDPDLANNSATDVDTVPTSGDLMITVDDGQTEITPGTTLTYTIVAGNPAGPSLITGARVTDLFPASLSCTWTGAGSPGTSYTSGPINGDLIDEVDLPAGGSVTYTALCRIANAATGTITNTASITGPESSLDPNPANDVATDTDSLRALDFGDAPDALLGPPWAYPVSISEDGARHGVASGFFLGARLDGEADGQANAGADGDDTTGQDDEDGVSFTSALVTGEEAAVTVTASAAGRLDAWVDFNADGQWDAGEQVFAGVGLAAGANALTFTIPSGASVTDSTYARFRLSSPGGLGVTGVTADGEVEDYAVAIRGVDFGDAADPDYPTLKARGGARHALLPGGPTLGALVDAEVNGQPGVAGDGDETAGLADEDGVAFTSALTPGGTVTLTVTASAASRLEAWVDFGSDGSWGQAGDQVFANRALTAGQNNLSFAVPPDAGPGLTFARFRLSSGGGLDPTGLAADGEVEDYQVEIPTVADLAITKNDGVASAVPGETVTYTIEVTNLGPSPVTGVQVTDRFPAQLSARWTCAPSGGATCVGGPASGDIQDTIDLPVGGKATYTALCTVAASAAGIISNTATVQAAEGVDPDSSNNSATDSDTVAPEGSLAVTKDDGWESAAPGETVSYTIVASNTGPSDAAGAGVSDTFPTSLSDISWSCRASGGSSCPSSGVGDLNETVTVAAGGDVTFTVVGRISPEAAGTLSNTATLTVPVGFADSGGGVLTATDTTTLAPRADLNLSLRSTGAARPGQPITYTIEVSNPGPSHAGASVVTDSFPAELTGVSWSCAGQGGAVCAPGGSGNLADSVNLPAGSLARYSITSTVAQDASGTIENTASVTVPAGVADSRPENNTDSDSAPVLIDSEADRELTVSPSSHLFGVEELDNCAAGSPVTFTVKNSGADPRVVHLVSLGGPDADQFSLEVDNCTNHSLAAGQTCTVEVRFCPTSVGSKGANLLITSDDAETPILTAFLHNHESAAEEARRRLPPVLFSLDVPEEMTEGQTYTLTWSLLGYDDDYESNIVFFDCFGITDGSCGDAYGSHFEESGNIAALAQEPGQWRYSGVQARKFSFSYQFTAPAVASDRDIVIRFYARGRRDANAGKEALSLLIPGNLSGRYYDNEGRRIVKVVKNSP